MSSSGILEKEATKSFNEIDTERLKIENRGDDNDASLVEGDEVAYYDDSSEDEEGSLDYDWHADNYKKYNNYVKHVLFSDIYKPRYVIENSKICKGNSKIFVFINSRVNNTNTRQVIRETYLKQFMKRKIPYGFLISMPEGKLAMRSIETENARFQDLVVVGSPESYTQLTLKTAHMLQWAATNCPHTTYVAKVDDDVYVNVKKFLKVLDAPRNFTILGKVCSSCVPFRGSHVALSQALRQFSNVVTRRHMPLTKFPPFAMGPAYVITLDVVPLLLEAAQEMVYFSYEDVFWTGLAAEMVSRESGMSVGVKEDPDSIKVKYQEMPGERLPSTQVHHEDVPGWRADRKSQQPLRIALTIARKAVTVHNINWVTDEQFVSSLQNI
ncbi:UDP-GalNAc:beta-1,3-N-acetylgalactosaminyltransferase 1-like [Procambarus clarkii]|uniref:UDP-GalNAc:beta-1, 3-N-acetylgalactosaminyltransferase 1-like n=1 Tax=Procambarus clarkii TaxID=6728 RepID=UPI0037448305